MIFVTVGGSTPFDRLIETMDTWAREQGRADVYAQIGASDLRPGNIRWDHFLPPDRFRAAMQEADLVIAHAGIGTVLTALDLRVPLLVMPRRAALGETRNDHQLATVQQLSKRGYLHVAMDEAELCDALARPESLTPPAPNNGSLVELQRAIVRFIDETA